MKHAVTAFSLAALLAAGCGGQSASPTPAVPAPAAPGGGTMTVGVTEDGFDSSTSTLQVGVRLTGEASFNDPRYGVVLGYFKGKTSTTSQVISLPMGRNVKFQNHDTTLPHTMSFLGNATKNSAPWPSTFTGSGTKAPAGTAIGTTNWSTGTLSPGQKSALYTTGLPGFYMMGCAFHYVLHGMRTVVIVK
jgi:plastocyanin